MKLDGSENRICYKGEKEGKKKALVSLFVGQFPSPAARNHQTPFAGPTRVDRSLPIPPKFAHHCWPPFTSPFPHFPSSK